MTIKRRRLLLLLGLSPLLVLEPGLGRSLAQTTYTTRITVDFQSIIRTIPPMLFGQNLQTSERGEGIVKPDGTIDADIMKLLSEVKLTSLRFPGGTSADFFQWWQATGPMSGRPEQHSGYLNRTYPGAVGPEEFLKISIALRAIPFVTANAGTGSAELAAAWVRYFKSRGFPVVFWEIGNEIYYEGLSEAGLKGLPPHEYAQRVIDYATAIRKEMPEAKIYMAGVIAPEDNDSYWNAVVLGRAGAYIDGVSIHNAYHPLYGYLADKTVPSDEYLFTALMAGTVGVDHSLSVLEDQLQRLGRDMPIFITEYDGIFFPNAEVEDPFRTVQRNPTLGCAVYNASALQVFLRHTRVHGAHHMSLTGRFYGSLVGADRGVHFRNPQFYVHREYAKEAGHLLMKATVEPQNALFDSGPVALLSAKTNVPMLDAIATRDAASSSYALFVVNRSLSQSVTTSIDLSVPPGATGTVAVLDGPSFISVNDADNPNRVTLVTQPFGERGAFSRVFPPHSVTVFRWKR